MFELCGLVCLLFYHLFLFLFFRWKPAQRINKNESDPLFVLCSNQQLVALITIITRISNLTPQQINILQHPYGKVMKCATHFQTSQMSFWKLISVIAIHIPPFPIWQTAHTSVLAENKSRKTYGQKLLSCIRLEGVTKSSQRLKLLTNLVRQIVHKRLSLEDTKVTTQNVQWEVKKNPRETS